MASEVEQSEALAKVSKALAEYAADTADGGRFFVILLIEPDGTGGVVANMPPEAFREAMRDYLAQTPEPGAPPN